MNILKDFKIEIIKLITIYGDEIIIEVPEKSFCESDEEMLEKLDNNELYFVGDYNEIARFKGNILTMIDMKKIIGRE